MFSMKKLFLISTVALLAACGASKPSLQNITHNPTPEPILVGVDKDYPPFDFFDENGQATGFDVAILQAIGEKQNLTFQFVPQTWDTITDNLEKKQFKIALSGFAHSDERAEKYAVSDTYAFGQDAIVTVKTAKQGKIPETREDLKKRKVITLADSPYIEELEAVLGKKNPNIISVATSVEILQGLIDGKAHAALTDKAVAQYFIQKDFPKTKFNLTGKGDYFTPYPLVFVAHKDEAALMQKVNAGLAEIIKDGSYTQIYKRWFGEEPKELPPVK